MLPSQRGQSLVEITGGTAEPVKVTSVLLRKIDYMYGLLDKYFKFK